MQLLVTVGLLWLLLRYTTLDELRRVAEGMSPGFLALTAGLVVLTGLSGAAALLVLFDWRPGPGWRAQFTLDYLYVQALCQLTPAQMGEAALPYVAGRGRLLPGQIAAALVLQRMLSLFIVIGFALWGAGQWTRPLYLWIGAAAIIGGAALVALLLAQAGFRHWVNVHVGSRIGPVLAGFYDAWVGMLKERPSRLGAHAALMLIRYGLSVATTYASLAAFSIHVPMVDLAALCALAVLAGLAPVTINGVGITEGIFVLALSSYGHSAQAVVAACLAGRLIQAVVMAGFAAAHALVDPDRAGRR